VKFITSGIPRGAQVSAFMPHYNRAAASGAVRYKASVSGQPGTMAIAAPTGDTVPSPDTGDLALAGSARSMNAPDFIWPNKYFDRTLDGNGTMGPVTPVRIYSDNMMPVPAQDPRGRPARLAKTVRRGGQRQVAQPRALPQWDASR
jgi:hypothetical protein